MNDDQALALALPSATLEHLADLVADRLAARRPAKPDGQWLDARAAALYLGLPSVSALHKLTAARAIPFSQTAPNAKVYLRRSDLDAYREAHMRGRR